MNLENAAIAFFEAIRETARGELGHDDFAFRVDISTSVKVADRDAAQFINAKIQAALNRAHASIEPIPVKASLQ